MVGSRLKILYKRALKYWDEIFISLLIVLVGVGGFLIGRLSLVDENKPEVRILSATAIRAEEALTGISNSPHIIETPSLKSGGQVVASKSGTKYHLPWCSGAKTIKEENKIWFASYEEARKAGYTPAANCKGIE
jgi:hypothetical protein